MRGPSLVVLLALAGGGCVRVENTVRTERGPLLRTFTRAQVLPGAVHAGLRVRWPTLALEVTERDVCLDTTIEEYAEERITERSSPAAGPALSTGLATTLGAGLLFGLSFIVSAAPDTSLIDTAGRYGPSLRQQLQGYTLLSLGIGLPALAVGAVAMLRSGEDVEARRVEQEASQRQAPCNPRPVTGAVTAKGPTGLSVSVPVRDGVGELLATGLPGPVDELVLGDRPVELDEAGLLTLAAFSACVVVEAEGARAPESLGDGALVARAERLRACNQVRGAEVEGPLAAAEAELARRRETGAPGAFAPGASVASFEDAVSAYAPRLVLRPGSTDLARLDAPESLEGQAVVMQGVVSYGLAQNIGVLELGGREVFVFIPEKRAWGGAFTNGSRVEAVAVMAGWQTVGEKTLPLARLVWLRAAY
ncbi:MAG: hypothetical protein INH41_24350 [Myxococcaceae bacterium]|nr:hypothetical protein [Myxococcaceae bacterium]MCA3015534.1 hypothetical protein [Myxococcaceae bacterium]